MKKIIKLLLLSLVLSSCSKENFTSTTSSLSYDIPIYKSSESLSTSFYNMNETTYKKLIENNSSFILYLYAATCSSCDSFTLLMKEYIAQTNYIIPIMDLDKYNTYTNSNFSNNSLLYFTEGKLTNYLSDFSDITSLKEIDSFFSSTFKISSTIFTNEITNKEFNSDINSYTFNSFKITKYYFDLLEENNSYLFFNEETNINNLNRYLLSKKITYLTYFETNEETTKYIEDLGFEYKNCIQVNVYSNIRSTITFNL